MDKFIIILSLLILLFLLTKINLNLKYAKESKTRLRLEEYRINMNLNIEDNVINQFNNLIINTFNEYIALNIEFKELEVITPDIENTISREVAKNVVEKMSPVFYDKLSLIYNKKEIPKIISNTVYMQTLAYTIEKNRLKEE